MVKEARDRVIAWLDALGEVRASAHLSVVHAVSELLSNVVEHAYAHLAEPGEMTLELDLSPTGELGVRVTDQGRWQTLREDPAALRGGRGLLLARNLLDQLDVTSDDGGTTATGTLAVTRAVSVSAPADLAGGAFEDRPFALVEEPGRLRVFGAVLLDAAAPLERRLRLLTQGGTVTDVDEEALTQARQASYTERELEAVPVELREKYFDPVGGRFMFRKELRRSVIFGRNDLIQDAPISHVDVLACRNTLMYFNAETQSQILNRMHFALRPDGVLFLGKAEMLLSHSALLPARRAQAPVLQEDRGRAA